MGTKTLTFSYDASGRPLTLDYSGTTYYYVTNLQGDVTAILSSSGTAVVQYTYDAWGNPLSTTGSMASTLGTLNPLRYRGYVYDTETGFYYLQSRCYDPQIGRFINADALVSTGQGLLGNNMFAYCLNNSVAYSDSGGTTAKVSLSAQTRIDDAPWRDISPGSGGYLPANYSQSVDYGSVEDKFFTVMLYKFINNTDAKAAASAEYFAFYKGAPIIKIPAMKDMAFSFGIIFMGDTESENLVKHEYGHVVHLSQIGVWDYLSKVVFPSVTSFWIYRDNPYYESQPWEYIAEYFGGTTPSLVGYQENADIYAFLYWLFTMIT